MLRPLQVSSSSTLPHGWRFAAACVILIVVVVVSVVVDSVLFTVQLLCLLFLVVHVGGMTAGVGRVTTNLERCDR